MDTLLLKKLKADLPMLYAGGRGTTHVGVIEVTPIFSGADHPESSGGSSSGGGGGLSGVFPSEALTADSENFFCYYDGETEQFMAYEGNVAFLGSYGDSYIIFDKDETTMLNNTSMWIKFKEPVTIKTISAKIGSTGWGVYGTNDEELFKQSILYNQANSDYGTPLIDSGEACGEAMTDFAVNPEGVAYKYYIFGYLYSYSYIYELALKTE